MTSALERLTPSVAPSLPLPLGVGVGWDASRWHSVKAVPRWPLQYSCRTSEAKGKWGVAWGLNQRG